MSYMNWDEWKPTTGLKPREGSCGTCIHIRRSAYRGYLDASSFACAIRLDEGAQIRYRVKARSLPPEWCPLSGVPEKEN